MATLYARPNSDISATAWTGDYTEINESSPDHGDFIYGDLDANGAVVKGLSTISEPDTPSAVTCTFWAFKSAAAGHDRQITMQIYEGGTARGGTIATGNLSETPTEYSDDIDLSAVSDWSALRVEFTSSGDIGTPSNNRRNPQVSFFVLEADGGPTFQAAWAKNSNKIIGAGIC